MTLSCPVCHDFLLFTDLASATQCGHIFHMNCLNRWLQSNRSCPHCRQPCTLSSTHRIYLPESHFEKNDILEKLTEVALAKQEQEKAIKELEKNNKKLEFELKLKKKQYHKVLNRSRKISKHTKTNNYTRPGTNNIPTMAGITTATTLTLPSSSSSHTVTPQSSTEKITNRVVQQDRPKKKRNASRVNRAKEYFRRKKAFYQNNPNNNSTERVISVSSSNSEDEMTMAAV